MTEKTIVYQSARIFYRIAGQGKPVILLHGFGEDGSIWQNQATFLQNHFHLIIPDLPGSGTSESIADMTMDGMAGLVKEIITIEFPETSNEAGSFVLIGHSMGGYITLAFAQNYPAIPAAFGLFHSSAFADSEEKKTSRLKSIEFINKNGAYEFLKTSLPGLFWHGHNGLKAINPYEIDLVENGKNFSPAALVAYYYAMINRPDRITVLQNFNRPVLFIIGENDPAIPFDQSLKQCYLPIESHVHILRNSAHMGMLEEPEKCNGILFDFLNAVYKTVVLPGNV
jgi:pimeloyl-ACP methyl ester carboxylesterase